MPTQGYKAACVKWKGFKHSELDALCNQQIFQCSVISLSITVPSYLLLTVSFSHGYHFTSTYLESQRLQSLPKKELTVSYINLVL